MTDPYLSLLRWANICLIIYAVVLVALGLWAIRGELPADVRARYKYSVILMSRLPLTEEWRKVVRAEDLEAFVESRRRRAIVIIALAVLIQILTGYAFLHATAATWRCEASR